MLANIFRDYVCQTSECFQIWKAVQIRLLGMDAFESEGAFPPTAKLRHTGPALAQQASLALPVPSVQHIFQEEVRPREP